MRILLIKEEIEGKDLHKKEQQVSFWVQAQAHMNTGMEQQREGC